MSTNSPKISVALCTYNGGRFLAEQLESIAEQTVAPDELVIGDDGSDDDTLGIIDAFRERLGFPVISFINYPRLGSTRNFEKVVRHCNGDIIFLSDQDDIWCPSKIEIALQIFRERSEVGFVFTDADLIDEHTQDLGAKLSDTTFPPKARALFEAAPSELLVWGNTVTGATMAFRRAYTDKFTLTPEIGMFSHDSWFAFTISLFAESAYIDRPLIKYRVHPGQQIGIGGEESGRDKSQRKRRFERSVDQASKLLQVVDSLSDHYRSESEGLVDELMLRRCLTRLSGVRSELLRFRIHALKRRDLPPSVFKRVPIIANELRTGNYSKYANGTRSALADLVY